MLHKSHDVVNMTENRSEIKDWPSPFMLCVHYSYTVSECVTTSAWFALLTLTCSLVWILTFFQWWTHRFLAWRKETLKSKPTGDVKHWDKCSNTWSGKDMVIGQAWDKALRMNASQPRNVVSVNQRLNEMWAGIGHVTRWLLYVWSFQRAASNRKK